MVALPHTVTVSAYEPDRPPSDLTAFSALLAERDDLCAALIEAQSPEEIVALAASEGLQFSRLELRLASRQLASSCWPWAGQGREARLEFFGEGA